MILNTHTVHNTLTVYSNKNTHTVNIIEFNLNDILTQSLHQKYTRYQINTTVVKTQSIPSTPKYTQSTCKYIQSTYPGQTLEIDLVIQHHERRVFV